MTTSDKPPLIESFRILGLHGYKDVELVWEGPARIVIAENGMGKTTILTALYAFLEGKLGKLRSLEFDSIECKLASSGEILQLDKTTLSELVDSPTQSLLLELTQYGDTDVSDLQQVIQESADSDYHELVEHPVIQEIYANSPFSYEDLAEKISEVRSSLHQSWPDIVKHVTSAVAAEKKSFDLLYLPTYRRIEIPLKSSEKMLVGRVRRRGLIRTGFGRIRRTHSPFPDPNIQFGLTDVSDRLTQLFEKIQRESNFGYRSISATIIDELLAGTFRENSPAPSDLPDIDTLSRFFSRIVTHDSSEQRLESLIELYQSGEINDKQNRMLRYFLDKLSVVVDQTKELEADIEEFVGKANGYLQQSSDEKVFSYDPTEMKVAVTNQWTGEEIDLDDLSSGEKQVVSLLASLYLYPQRKFVLIDEPELSLSIDWQKRLLPDMLGSPSCAQLLAITHSPFIFENDLDPFAGPLKIVRHRSSDVPEKSR